MSYDIQPQPGAQTRFLASNADFAIYGGSAGSGKLQYVNTIIHTLNGMKLLGDINESDILFDEKGNLCHVLKAHEITFPETAYRLTFDDGSVIDCGGEHLWLTYTADDLTKLTIRNPEWKERRREKRPSRTTGNKSALFTQRIRERNAERAKQLAENNLPLPTGSVKTTEEIVSTLKVRNNTRVNHAIPVCKPWNLPEVELPIPPYTLGAWIGDGSTNCDGTFTKGDVEVIDEIRKDGFIVNKRAAKYGWGILKLGRRLKENNFVGHKHIPLLYLRSSYEQRLALMQGLMDTDGYANPQGSTCEYTTILPELADNVFDLAISLGFKATKRVKQAKLYGKDYGECFTIAFSTDVPVFRLPRKLNRQMEKGSRRVNLFRYIVSAERIDPIPMRCLTVDSPSHLFLCGQSGIPTHNSYALLLEASRHINNPGFGAVIFRREQKMIVCEGGLRDTAMEIYPHLGGQYRAQPTPSFIFPSGAKISFAHLNQESEVLNWQGSQIPMIGYDELSHFSDFQWNYMISRMRSTCGVRPYCRATTNPDSDSWVANLLDWWIDQNTGFPIKERSGVLRYFIRVNGEMKWADTREDLANQYGCALSDPKSLTFVSAKITDNPILLKKDPAYLGNLKALSKVERARLLDGNWKIRAVAGMYFPREDAQLIDWVPAPGEIIKYVRSWDLAASEESDGRDPDWTVGMLLGRRQSNGKIVIVDVIHVRRKAADVRALIRNVAAKDGREVWISIPQDPGQAGRDQADSYKQLLAGYTVLSRSITKNKTTMAEPAAALWQQGNIELVRAPWNEELMDELEQFPEGRHDDLIDALSAGVRALPGHAKPDYSKTGLSGRFKEIRTVAEKPRMHRVKNV